MAGRKLGVKNWTKEELEYLQENWGSVSIRGIAKKLGRSIDAVKCRAIRTGLNSPKLHYDGITVNQLLIALNKSYNAIYPWIRDYGMPVREKLFAEEMRVKVITYSDFWKWAEGHKELLNFAKMEPGTLGPEPAWMKLKRQADQLRSQKTKQAIPWSPKEDQQLVQLVQLEGMTYPRLAKHFNRSESAAEIAAI